MKDINPNQVAYCGLVCDLCHLAGKCSGCRTERNICGKHLSEAGCFQRECCIKRHIRGCWECGDFPCNRDMYSDENDPKVKAFARCIREDGMDRFLSYVHANQKRGVDIRLHGDYDGRTGEEVLVMLRKGFTKK